MTYDAENRVVSAADGSGTATYAYDGLGHRIQKTFSGTTTTYVFSGNDVLSEYAGGTLTNEYIRQGRTLVAEYNSGTLTYHGRDPLSVRLSMDANGNTSGQQGHFPFGENWYNTNATTKWHFTVYERDSESSNDYATFRYHVNRLGRFSSLDPVRPRGPQPQSLNRYAYVASDPINRKDRDGLMYDTAPNLMPTDSAGCPYESELDAWIDYGITAWEYMSDYPGCPTDGAGSGGGGGVACSDGANCSNPEPPAPPPGLPYGVTHGNCVRDQLEPTPLPLFFWRKQCLYTCYFDAPGYPYSTDLSANYTQWGTLGAAVRKQYGTSPKYCPFYYHGDFDYQVMENWLTGQTGTLYSLTQIVDIASGQY